MVSESRKKLIECLNIRTKMIGLRLTVITAAAGASLFRLGNDDKMPFCLLLIFTALVALSFDYLINSYSYSIRRVGYYLRNHIEPNIELKPKQNSPHAFLKWEDFLFKYEYSVT